MMCVCVCVCVCVFVYLKRIRSCSAIAHIILIVLHACSLNMNVLGFVSL